MRATEVARTPAIPASQISASTGSCRACADSSPSSRSAAKTGARRLEHEQRAQQPLAVGRSRLGGHGQNLVRTLGRVRTALVIAVPEAEPLVGPARSRYDLADKTGIPAHITILFPFGDREDGLEELVRAAFRRSTSRSRASGAGRRVLWFGAGAERAGSSR